MSFGTLIFAGVFWLIVGAAVTLTVIITLRQLTLTLSGLALPESPHTVANTDPAEPLWPRVSIIVPAHNEEAVIGDGLRAILQTDYPRDRLDIIVVNDRSQDRTGEIIDRFADQNPVLRALHRSADATPGKSAALKDVIAMSRADIFVFFDADYLPAPSLVRELVKPFDNPRIGATMGRVVPVNSNANLLTRLIDLERRAGYVVDQQMRNRWGLLPQFGGTVGAVRASTLEAVGGWQAGLMTEDTHLTYSLFLNGYDVAYLNHAACYEETPEKWPTRYKQVRRWSYGHNECLIAFLLPTLRAKDRSWLQRLDASVVLTFYLFPALTLAALPMTLVAPAILGVNAAWMLFSLVPLFCGFGNLAPFFQMILAAVKDRQPHVLSVAPLLPLSSYLNMIAASHGLWQLLSNRLRSRRAEWDKTARFREIEPSAHRTAGGYGQAIEGSPDRSLRSQASIREAA